MATALQHIESHWNSTVVPSILEQYKDSGKWQAMLKAVIDQMQIAEDAAAEFLTILDFKSEVPTGDRLDFIAGLVNVTRFAGESDELFYTRFLTSLSVWNAGTPDNVIYNAAILSGDPHPQYMDEAPATFFVYDGPRPVGEGEWEQGGHQLSSSQVRKLAPAGVLGLPGAVIQLADGSFLGTVGDVELTRVVTEDGLIVLTEEGQAVGMETTENGHQEMFLMAALDDEPDVVIRGVIVDGDGNPITTSDGTPIEYVSKLN